MVKNVKMPAVPNELIASFNPSALSLGRSHKTKRDVLPKVDAVRMKSLKVRDFDRFVMLLLATVGMVSNSQMKALLTCVPAGKDSPIGFEGMTSDLMTRFGVTFDMRRAIGQLHNPDAAYMALRRMAKKGLARTVLQGQNVQVQTDLAGRGVEVAWVLTPLGAAVLLRLTTKKELTVDDLRFNIHDNRVALITQAHDLGVSSFLTGLCVGAAYYSNREKPIRVDVVRVVGDGKDFVMNGKKFRPDLSVVLFIQKVFVPLFIEWNNDNTTNQNITDKTVRFQRLMLDAPAEAWSAGRPWLIFTSPTEGRVESHEKAIREAAKRTGLLAASTYDPMDWAGIAVCTFEDLGRFSPYGAIYRLFDYSTGKLTGDKYTLVSLHRSEVAAAPAEEPRNALPPQWTKVVEAVREEADNGANPPEWTKSRRGAAAPLIGHIEDEAASAPLVGYILNGGA